MRNLIGLLGAQRSRKENIRNSSRSERLSTGIPTATDSLSRSAERIIATVDVRDGFQLWSESYDREMEEVFAAQDEIARSISDRLKLTLKGDQSRSWTRGPITSKRRPG